MYDKLNRTADRDSADISNQVRNLQCHSVSTKKVQVNNKTKDILHGVVFFCKHDFYSETISGHKDEFSISLE